MSDATENSISAKQPLTGWAERCSRACPLASEREPAGAEEKAEESAAPAWSASGPKGQGKLSESQKDDTMARTTGESLSHPGSSPNQCLPVPFAKQQEVEESAEDPPVKDRRSGGLCPCDFISPGCALEYALSVLLMHLGASETLTC